MKVLQPNFHKNVKVHLTIKNIHTFISALQEFRLSYDCWEDILHCHSTYWKSSANPGVYGYVPLTPENASSIHWWIAHTHYSREYLKQQVNRIETNQKSTYKLMLCHFSTSNFRLPNTSTVKLLLSSRHHIYLQMDQGVLTSKHESSGTRYAQDKADTHCVKRINTYCKENCNKTCKGKSCPINCSC